MEQIGNHIAVNDLKLIAFSNIQIRTRFPDKKTLAANFHYFYKITLQRNEEGNFQFKAYGRF